jgi:hypothetical protein
MSMTSSQSFVERLGANRFARLAPFLVLGPVSGPLTAGIVLNLRAGRPVLAALYGVALAMWLTVASFEVTHLLPAEMAHFL